MSVLSIPTRVSWPAFSFRSERLAKVYLLQLPTCQACILTCIHVHRYQNAPSLLTPNCQTQTNTQLLGYRVTRRAPPAHARPTTRTGMDKHRHCRATEWELSSRGMVGDEGQGRLHEWCPVMPHPFGFVWRDFFGYLGDPPIYSVLTRQFNWISINHSTQINVRMRRQMSGTLTVHQHKGTLIHMYTVTCRISAGRVKKSHTSQKYKMPLVWDITSYLMSTPMLSYVFRKL